MELRIPPRVTAFLVGLILTFVLAAPMWGQPPSFINSEEATSSASTLGLPAWLASWWEELRTFAGASDGGPHIDLDGVALADDESAESFTSDPTEEEGTTERGPHINIDG